MAIKTYSSRHLLILHSGIQIRHYRSAPPRYTWPCLLWHRGTPKGSLFRIIEIRNYPWGGYRMLSFTTGPKQGSCDKNVWSICRFSYWHRSGIVGVSIDSDTRRLILGSWDSGWFHTTHTCSDLQRSTLVDERCCYVFLFWTPYDHVHSSHVWFLSTLYYERVFATFRNALGNHYTCYWNSDYCRKTEVWKQ